MLCSNDFDYCRFASNEPVTQQNNHTTWVRMDPLDDGVGGALQCTQRRRGKRTYLVLITRRDALVCARPDARRLAKAHGASDEQPDDRALADDLALQPANRRSRSGCRCTRAPSKVRDPDETLR